MEHKPQQMELEIQILVWDKHGNSGPGVGQARKFRSWCGTSMEIQVLVWDKHGNSGPGVGQAWKFRSWCGTSTKNVIDCL